MTILDFEGAAALLEANISETAFIDPIMARASVSDVLGM